MAKLLDNWALRQVKKKRELKKLQFSVFTAQGNHFSGSIMDYDVEQ